MRIKSIVAAVLAGVTATVLAASSTVPVQTCYTKAVAAGLKQILKLPGDILYEQSLSSYWAESTLRPWLIAQPRSAKEVAIIVKIIGEIPSLQFAVRSGGHMNWVGANNIQNGVTIDLSLLNSTTYSSSTKLASIGPGGHWKNVYAVLDKAGVVVAGARDGNVGVGGFLLGGGISYYATRVGLSCNSVKNFEVVLATGEIINVNKTSKPDLFLALKGGANNFGIVTRFDLEAWPKADLWGGNIVYGSTASDDLADAFTTFTSVHNDNLDSTFIGLYTYTPDFGDIVTVASVFNLDGVADGPVFDEFRAVQPQLSSTLGNVSMAEAARTMFLPPGEYSSWYTMTYKNDATLSKFMTSKHAELVSFLRTHIPDGNFTTQVAFQSFPTVFVEAGVAAGGNVIGLEESIPEDAVLLLFTSSLHTEAQRKIAVPKMNQLFADMKNKASAAGKLYKWEYLNYAHPTQNPLATYGANNIAKIKAAAKKYDPTGFFQKRLPGGWKISKV